MEKTKDTKDKAALIIAAMEPKTPKKAAADEESVDEDYEAAKEDAASSMMGALKSNDPKAFASALADFISMCGM